MHIFKGACEVGSFIVCIAIILLGQPGFSGKAIPATITVNTKQNSALYIA